MPPKSTSNKGEPDHNSMATGMTRLATFGLALALLGGVSTSPGGVADSGARHPMSTRPFAAFPDSIYFDPCEGSADLDLRALTVSDLFESDRETLSSDPVTFTWFFCDATPDGAVEVLRADLFPRLDRGGPDYAETPSRWVVVTPGTPWIWDLHEGLPGGGSIVVDSGFAAPIGAVSARTGGSATIPSAEIFAAASPSSGPFPPLAIRACSGDVDCGPEFNTDPITGDIVLDPLPQDASVDYLPEPKQFQLTYPSLCQLGSVATMGTTPSVTPRSSFPTRPAPDRRHAKVPDDPLFLDPDGAGVETGQWSLARIGAEAAWDATTGDPGATIAILDSGLDGLHPDLAGRAVAARDFIATRSQGLTPRPLQTSADTDLGGHGSHVASLAAAATKNGIGMASLGWRTRLLIGRVFDAELCASDDSIVNAIDWAIAQGAVTINMSLGGTDRSISLQLAGERAEAAGVMLVAAAGNSGGGLVEYPAAYDEYVSVAATGYIAPSSALDDPVASYSTRNAFVDIAAPGGDGNLSRPERDLYGACWAGAVEGRSWCRGAGTSFASPLVAAAFALARHLDPGRTVIGMRQLLEDNARDITTRPGTGPGYDNATGAGRLDAGRALSLLAAREATLSRVGNRSPISTAAAVSKLAFPAAKSAQIAVIARDDVFADALAGSALSQDRGPILLTPSFALDDRVRDELLRALPLNRTVYLLGGPKAIDPSVEDAIRALGYADVRRVWGATRIETAIEISRLLGVTRGTQVLIASAANWPDAIAGGAYAATHVVPVLLVWPDDADSARTPGLLARLGELDPSDIVILGGPAAIFDEVESDLKSAFPGRVRRVWGDTRYHTAVEIARELWGRATGKGTDEWVLVSGQPDNGWTYGLAAALPGAQQGAPLLLVRDGLVVSEPADYLRNVLRYRLSRSAHGLFVGPYTSDASVEEFTVQRLRELLGG